jgi:hypothetical protein
MPKGGQELQLYAKQKSIVVIIRKVLSPYAS